MKREDGFSVLEGLIALAILGIVLSSVLNVFVDFMQVTTRNEARSGAIAAAQIQIEASRQEDPVDMPTSGVLGPSYIAVDDREYEVFTRYCELSAFCGAESRHVVIEVSYGGKTIYTTESVFTKLR